MQSCKKYKMGSGKCSCKAESDCIYTPIPVAQPAQGVRLTEEFRRELYTLVVGFAACETERARDHWFNEIESAILARQPAPMQSLRDIEFDGPDDPHVAPPFAAPASQHDANGRAAVPEGWSIRKDTDCTIIVQKPSLGGCALGGPYENVENIEHTIFYAFLDDLLAAAPASVAQEGEQSYRLASALNSLRWMLNKSDACDTPNMRASTLLDKHHSQAGHTIRADLEYLWDHFKPSRKELEALLLSGAPAQQTSAQVDAEGGDK